MAEVAAEVAAVVVVTAVVPGQLVVLVVGPSDRAVPGATGHHVAMDQAAAGP